MQYSKCEKTQNKTLEGHPSAATLVPEWCVREKQWGDSSRVPTPRQERLLKLAENHVRVAWELFSVNVITPQIGLNRITREQNVPNIRILPCSFCEEPQTCKPKHEIYTLHFLFDKYTAVPRSPFLCGDRTQNFSESKKHSGIMHMYGC